ncbi:hypothetical protein P7C73_g5410, partial [Tremellales sp. Uapishka_1]
MVSYTAVLAAQGERPVDDSEDVVMREVTPVREAGEQQYGDIDMRDPTPEREIELADEDIIMKSDGSEPDSDMEVDVEYEVEGARSIIVERNAQRRPIVIVGGDDNRQRKTWNYMPGCRDIWWYKRPVHQSKRARTESELPGADTLPIFITAPNGDRVKVVNGVKPNEENRAVYRLILRIFFTAKRFGDRLSIVTVHQTSFVSACTTIDVEPSPNERQLLVDVIRHRASEVREQVDALCTGNAGEKRDIFILVMLVDAFKEPAHRTSSKDLTALLEHNVPKHHLFTLRHPECSYRWTSTTNLMRIQYPHDYGGWVIELISSSAPPSPTLSDSALLDSLEDSGFDLESHREKRLEELQQQIQKVKILSETGYGRVVTYGEEKKLIERMAASVADTPFLVVKFGVQVLPCVMVFVDGSCVDRLIGFEELGDSDKFTLGMLEFRLKQSGVFPAGPINLAGVLSPSLLQSKSTSKNESDNDSDDEDWSGKGYHNNRSGTRKGKTGIRNGLASRGSDDD